MQLTEIALSALPLVGQQLLAKHPDVKIRTAIARSPLTDVTVIDVLVEDPSSAVRIAAYLRTTNVEALASELSDLTRRRVGKRGHAAGSSGSKFASRNPNAPTELLIKALGCSDVAIAIGAYINPATPEEARRKLTAKRAQALATIGGSAGDQVVRAHELVLANPWMLDASVKWDDNIRRAIAGMPDVSIRTLARLKKTGRAGASPRKWHPTANGKDIDTLDIGDLIILGRSAPDLAAMNRPEFTEKHAKQILARGRGGIYTKGKILNSERQPEPHVIGRLVNRYGAAIAYRPGETKSGWAGTRDVSAAWIAPVINSIDWVHTQRSEEILKTVVILGTNSTHWETFCDLLPHWHGTYDEAALAVRKL